VMGAVAAVLGVMGRAVLGVGWLGSLDWVDWCGSGGERGWVLAGFAGRVALAGVIVVVGAGLGG
jgi:hypothetical protein